MSFVSPQRNQSAVCPIDNFIFNQLVYDFYVDLLKISITLF